MTTRITSLNCDQTGETIGITTEHGESFEARVIASDAGYTIANYDAGDRWVAIQVADFGDGDAEFYESREDDTFDADHRGQFVVRRTDNAGSLEWAENGV